MSMIGNYLRLPSSKHEALLANPNLADELAFPDEDEDNGSALDIDKSWHLIHYLLNGDSWSGSPPFANVVLGGTALEGTDAGYGPYRVLSPEQVAEAAQALEGVSAEALWSRFNLAEVRKADIYPSGWREDSDERLYTLHHYERLRQYFADAAQAKEAMLLFIA